MPFLFKYAIDALTADPLGQTLADMPLVQLLPATVLLGYGAARAASSLCNELRNAVFAKVCSQPSYPPLQIACDYEHSASRKAQASAVLSTQ